MNSLRAIALMLCLCFPSTMAWSLPEGQLLDQYEELIEAFWQTGTNGNFRGVNDHVLSYWSRPPAQDNGPKLLLVPGFGEPYLRYAELLHDLQDLGFGYFSYDHRGMALSGELAANPQTIHVDAFQHYVQDLDRFYREVVTQQHGDGPVYLLAHSMGGLTALHWLATYKPQLANVTLSAPLLGLETGGIPTWAARLSAKLMVWLGYDQSYVFGRQDRNIDEMKPEDARATSSMARQSVILRIFREHSATLNGGPSQNWLKETLAAIDRIHPLAPRIDYDILLLQAEIEHFAIPAPQTDFCRALPRCQLEPIPGAMHELLHERDELRDQALAALRQQLGRAP